MILWKRYCLAPNCAHGQRLAAIAAASGLLSRDLCTLSLYDECRSRQKQPLEPVGRLWGAPVVSAFRLDRLKALSEGDLIDILHNITAPDLWIIHKWAQDYTQRRIPWAVIRRGERFALLKERRR
jgi:hypothetical protein